MTKSVVGELLGRAEYRWLVTGAAGFIGSHLVEQLLLAGQTVVGFDNFATGYQRNLDLVLSSVSSDQRSRFRFVKGDIRDGDACREVCRGVDYVLHQAALGSVPRSVDDPATSTAVNVNGTLNVFIAARDAKVRRLVYASSSSVYGDDEGLPKIESRVGRVLSPYALTKAVNEQFAGLFASLYGFESIGLRYFNVVGSRQDPSGAYAAVIPRWVDALVRGEPCTVFGDGETSRDFCDVRNVVQANVRAALALSGEAVSGAYNVAVGERATLNELYDWIASALRKRGISAPEKPVYAPFRAGDIRHSLADISRSQRLLGYQPIVRARQGVEDVVEWFVASGKPF